MDGQITHGRFFTKNKLAPQSLTELVMKKKKEMRKPECREGKERDKDMRKINRTVPTAISVKRKAHAG